MSQETRDRYAELNQRETDAYEDRYQLEENMRNARSITLDKIEEYIKEFRNKLDIVDFLYFSVGISTTTTFGDIVANDRVVRAVVSFQLILSYSLLVALLIRLLQEKLTSQVRRTLKIAPLLEALKPLYLSNSLLTFVFNFSFVCR
jgi:hypothetical protein